jgi:mRNA interferase RelE/StbE
MPYEIHIDDRAFGDLKRVDKGDLEKIDASILALKDDPRPRGCKQLAGYPGIFRVRCGDYRIIYRVEEGKLLVLVVYVGHRRDVYKRFKKKKL